MIDTSEDGRPGDAAAPAEAGTEAEGRPDGRSGRRSGRAAVRAVARWDGSGGPDDGGSVARGSVVNLVGSGIYGVTSFLLIVVVTRQLGTSGAGALLESIAVFSLIARSAAAGTDSGLVRFTSRFIARGRAAELRHLYLVALVPVVVLSTAAGLAVFLAAEPLGDLLSAGDHDHLTAYLRVLAPFVPVAAVYQVVDGGSRGFGTMLPSVLVERISRSSLVPLLVLAASIGGGATVVGLAWAAPYALALVPAALWTSVLLRRAERSVVRTVTDRADRADRPDGTDLADAEKAEPDPTDTTPGSAPAPLATGVLARRFWAFTLPRSFGSVFAVTITWIDTLLLGAMAGSTAVGVYGAAVRWLIVGNLAGNAVTMAFAPQIARVMASSPDRARPLFQDASALLVLLAWPAYLAVIVFAPFLLTAFGDGFSDGATVITITGVGFLLASAAGPIDSLLVMAGRSRQSLGNTAIALAVNIGANVLLIPDHGIRGAAWAWTVSLVVANGLPLWQMRRRLGVHPFGSRTLRTLALTGATGLALVGARALAGPTAAGLAIGLVAGGAVLVAGVLASPDRLGVDQLVRRPAP